MSLNVEINLRNEIEKFAPTEDIQHAFLLTYTFDGEFIEDTERGLLEAIWQRNCDNVLVLRDGKAVLTEKRAHRYSVINAAYSRRTFHPKLLLLLASSEILVVIGSANLTQGGLGGNLELVGNYRLTQSSGPLAFFQSLRRYLDENYLQRELALASPQQRAGFAQLIRDFDRFLAEVRVGKSPVEPIFLHNYDQPLLPQIIQTLPGKNLDAIWIVSPFFETNAARRASLNSSTPDLAKHLVVSDDPPDDSFDQTLLKTLLAEFNFGKQGTQPPVRIYFQASATNVTNLPLQVLQPFKSQLALFKRDAGLVAKTLHAKLFVFLGQGANGKPFITTVFGSANFTRAALLTRPPHGNAEVVVVTHLPRAGDLADKLETYLNLNQLFVPVNNWETLIPQQPPQPPSIPPVLVWEGLVSLARQTVTIFFQIDNRNARRAVVTLQGEAAELELGEIMAPFAANVEFPLPATALVVINQEIGLRQLPYQCVRIEIFDATGQSLGWGEGPLNVDCPAAFIGNWQPDQLWHEAVDAQIYLAGLGQTGAYQAWRNHLEQRLSPGPKNPATLLHQADLDLFFRRLHLGLRGVRRKLEQTQGSLYVFGDMLRQLARWAKAAVDEKQKLTVEQRLYLGQRLLQTVQEGIVVLQKANRKPEALVPILREEFLSEASCIADFARGLRDDVSLGLAAQHVLTQWDLLSAYPERGRP